MQWKYLYLCKNDYPDKIHIAPIIPDDVYILTRHGICVFIEPSDNRIYEDSEYVEKGGILTNIPLISPSHCLAVSWSKSDEQDPTIRLLHEEYPHIYVSDLQAPYPCSHIAGYVACGLGLSQFFVKNMVGESLEDLGQWETKNDFKIQLAQMFDLCTWPSVSIGIIGGISDYGIGVTSMLNEFALKYVHITDKTTCTMFDILFYCNSQENDCDEPWFSPECISTTRGSYRSRIWVDVASSPGTVKHPFRNLYNTHTTLAKPVITICETLDIIALDDYCMILPRVASNEMSKTLIQLFMDHSYPNKRENKTPS